MYLAEQRFLKLSPVLLFSAIIVLVLNTNVLVGDESRYLMFAKNLTNGYYSPKDEINLWNGPGYPIVLALFIFLGLPILLTAKMLNAVLMFFAVLYFYSTLKLYIYDEKKVIAFSYLFALYPPFYRYMHLILTESLSIFLICGFMYHFCKIYIDNKKRSHLFFASFYMAYLALTKIFFGYVILIFLIFSLMLYLWKRKGMFKKTFLIYSFALLLCLPYLIYTYSLTNKIFYWGNSGGLSLYWMSTPYENELGDWKDFKDVINNPQLSQNHKEFFDRLEKYPSVQRDEELKRRAIQNIVNNPEKFLKNWVANIGRLLFNYPYSYAFQSISTYFYLIPNMFLVAFGMVCFYLTYVGRKNIPYEIYTLILFGLISFGGSSLVSAYNRQFALLVPIFALWILFIFSNVLRIDIRK
jgi:hypothetical protein